MCSALDVSNCSTVLEIGRTPQLRAPGAVPAEMMVCLDAHDVGSVCFETIFATACERAMTMALLLGGNFNGAT